MGVGLHETIKENKPQVSYSCSHFRYSYELPCRFRCHINSRLTWNKNKRADHKQSAPKAKSDWKGKWITSTHRKNRHHTPTPHIHKTPWSSDSKSTVCILIPVDLHTKKTLSWPYPTKCIECQPPLRLSTPDEDNWARLHDIDRSHFKGFTRVVPLFSIVVCGELSRRSVKKNAWGRGLLGCAAIRCA